MELERRAGSRRDVEPRDRAGRRGAGRQGIRPGVRQGQRQGPDQTIKTCSTNNRQQNEPAAAVNPKNTKIITSGSNDYCTVETTNNTWAGF